MGGEWFKPPILTTGRRLDPRSRPVAFSQRTISLVCPQSAGRTRLIGSLPRYANAGAKALLRQRTLCPLQAGETPGSINNWPTFFHCSGWAAAGSIELAPTQLSKRACSEHASWWQPDPIFQRRGAHDQTSDRSGFTKVATKNTLGGSDHHR